MNQEGNIPVVLETHEYFISLFQQFKEMALANPEEKFNDLVIDIERLGQLDVKDISNLPPYPTSDKNDDDYVEDIIEAKIENIPYFTSFRNATREFHFKGTIWLQRFGEELFLIERQGNVELLMR